MHCHTMRSNQQNQVKSAGKINSARQSQVGQAMKIMAGQQDKERTEFFKFPVMVYRTITRLMLQLTQLLTHYPWGVFTFLILNPVLPIMLHLSGNKIEMTKFTIYCTLSIQFSLYTCGTIQSKTCRSTAILP